MCAPGNKRIEANYKFMSGKNNRSPGLDTSTVQSNAVRKKYMPGSVVWLLLFTEHMILI
jgi:hypothetical protein